MTSNLLTTFLQSRRQGLSPRAIEFYRTYLKLSKTIIGFHVTSQQISVFLESLRCSNGGKHTYFSSLRVFYNWLCSRKSGFGLNPQENPMLSVDPPKVEKKILPSLTIEQVTYLINQVEHTRDKAIISLFTDSGLRLSELAMIRKQDIDWKHRLIRVRYKGNKEGPATYGEKTEALLEQWFTEYNPNGSNIWGVNKWVITEMPQQLRAKTGLPCNPHTFRRTFASILANRGVDSLHIMRLGRWESIQMVERYTRSVRFEDSLRLYSAIVE